MADHQEALANVPLFAKLPKKSLNRLSRIVVERSYPAGSVIVREGEAGMGFFLIEKGAVDIVHGPEEKAVNTLKQGEYFGEMALLDGHPRSATVRAVDETTCLVLPRWEFLAEVRNDAEMAIDILEVLSLRIRDLENKLYA